MLVLLSALSWIVIAACQCYHVFRNYKKLCELEILINTLMNISHGIAYHVKGEKPEKEPKKVGANRNARTQEQKLKASAKRKEWWERKRAMERKIPEPTVKEGLIPNQAALIRENQN